MNTPTKLGAYGLGLLAVFGAALGVGNAVGPVGATPKATSHTEAAGHTQSEQAAGGHGDAHTTSAGPQQAAQDTPGGLQVSQGGYTLTPLTGAIEPDTPTEYRFTVTGPDGEPVTDYQVEHDKKLHFIVVSRDLGSFQHLHPDEAGGGVWSVRLTLPAAGAYRAFADFVPTGGSALTLGTDLLVAGDYEPQAIPATTRTAKVDGYTVTLDGDLVPGRSSKLTLKVSKDGEPVTDLQPYLGAYGHLVALRAGDLAYLHVHPDGEPGDGTTAPGPEIVFYAEAPSRGDYRLFLDFQHQGKVRTADFTLSVGKTGAIPTPKPTETGESDGHADDGHTH
ncbi:hypothetical protein HNP84_008257 [Thermocatellispora tengchongensis]|uniref:Heavy metal-binding domain-containing protein n=1 Tax=Thermocatellispora tengchongensis TaxID=1073253 RepID=A0A840PKP9_9ACTN|nr:hypothetical protein [Thermocatellispora tengchongensis]MBB5138503.1 hypothetical protein [Thermocatellispora tengchongensis]